ncbi:hypothetical protein HYT02_01355, partial [Candidatus Gottesmanbacteria bacterium]|nr:hypothetical protein [Candidatus Gottesmanbacteria bacterium]
MLRKINIKIFLLIAIIGFLNIAVIYPWFSGGYTVNSGSFEPVYTSYSPGFTFNLLWYLGFPNRFAFPPLFFYLGTSTPISYHITTGLFFIILPLSLIFFLRTLKLSWYSSLAATTLFIFYPSIFYILPSLYTQVAQFSFPPPLLLFLSYYGLGPRIIGLVFSLLALAFLFRYLKDNKYFLLTVLLSASVFLIDQVTSVGYIILATALVLSFTLFKPIPKLKKLILITYGLIAWFYNFSYLKNL